MTGDPQYRKTGADTWNFFRKNVPHFFSLEVFSTTTASSTSWTSHHFYASTESPVTFDTYNSRHRFTFSKSGTIKTFGRCVYSTTKIFINGTSTVGATYSSSGSSWQEWTPEVHVDAEDYIHISTTSMTNGTTKAAYYVFLFLED